MLKDDRCTSAGVVDRPPQNDLEAADAGLTPYQRARLLGIPVEEVRAIENGNLPSVDVLCRMNHIYGLKGDTDGRTEGVQEEHSRTC